MYWRPGARIMIGVFLLVASTAKAWSVSQLALTMQFVAQPLVITDRHTLTVLAAVVILWEGLLGLSLILALKPHLTLLATAITLAVFTGVLCRLLFAHAPDCPCLGKIEFFHSLLASIPFGIGRNCILLGAVCWLLSQRASAALALGLTHR